MVSPVQTSGTGIPRSIAQTTDTSMSYDLPDTPVMKQYFSFKKDHPDKVLFFRMGDFYEMFGDDAVTAANLLNIQLTSRNKNSSAPFPMCGVPAHSADKYIYRLIAKGVKVAVCDQVESSSASKSIVKRDITRILTPGTVFEENETNAGKNNFICSLDKDGKNYITVTFCDYSTGEIDVLVSEPGDDQKQLFDFLGLYRPNEVLMREYKNETRDWQIPFRDYFNTLPKTERRHINIETPDDYSFDPDTCRKKLLIHFKVNTLEVFGLPDIESVFSSVGVILNYLCDTQKEPPHHIAQPRRLAKDGFMHLDDCTLKNLEIFQNASNAEETHTLFWIVNKTSTGMGARKLRRMLQMPLTRVDLIQNRQHAVQELIEEQKESDALRRLLKKCGDTERISARLSLPGFSPRDAVFLRNTLETFPRFYELITPYSSALFGEYGAKFDTVDDALTLLNTVLADTPAIKFEDGGVIAPGVSKELDELKDLKTNGRQKIAEMETAEKKKTGIANLKIRFNKVFGYYIEISNASKHLAPDSYIRRQTLTGAERFITQELKELEENLINAESKINQIEIKLFAALHDDLKVHTPRLMKSATIIAEIDALLSMARVSAENRYVRPELSDDATAPLEIKTGRHPVIEIIQQHDEPFIPNDLTMIPGERFFHLITGPNMGGKSTYMRQTALIVLMAHVGCFVPAEYASMPIFDRIFTRVGASDNLTRGQSTFMVEMNETASILNQLTPRSLVILDEIGRGTGTYDGMALARSITEYLHAKKTLTLFATHYHELAKLEDTLAGLSNFRIAVSEHNNRIVFLKKVLPGVAGKSYGIHVAEMAGLPKDVIQRAQSLLENLETERGGINSEHPDVTVSQKNNPSNCSKNRVEQLDFFGDFSHPVLDSIRNLDVNSLSPIDSLNILHKFKEELQK